MKAIFIAFATTACAVALVSCGGGLDASATDLERGTGGADGTIQASGGGIVPGAREFDVYEADNTFFYDNRRVVMIKIKAGDRLRFKNKDGAAHTLYSISAGNTFEVGTLRQYQSRSVALAQRGEVEVRCRVHPDMQLMVDVR